MGFSDKIVVTIVLQYFTEKGILDMELGFNAVQIKELLAGGRTIIEVMKEYAPIFLERFKSQKSGVIKRQQQEKGINDYIATCLSRNYYMNTIVFRGQQKCILDLYVPLHIRKRSMRGTASEVPIDENVVTALSEYDRVMIVDTAGMGKTTIVKYIALQVILRDTHIPIVIELRNYDSSKKFESFVHELFLINSQYAFTFDEIRNMIDDGNFVFFLDGFDEVPECGRGDIINEIKDFCARAARNKFILTSRDESNLLAFSEFQEFNIQKLRLEEACDLIRKYDNDGELSSQLIEKIQNDPNMRILNELLTNPLLVSLLYKAYEYKQDVNYKKHIFYRQVYSALFEDHDLVKGGAYKHEKKSGLDIEDFRRVLNKLAFIMLKNEVIDCDKYYLLDRIKEALTAIPKNRVKEHDFLDDLIVAVPFFVIDGERYRWVHKSFCEYFAACFICEDAKDHEDTLLLGMINSYQIHRYINVLDFCYDLDPLNFRKTVLLGYLDEYIDHYGKTFTDSAFAEYDQAGIDTMRTATFLFDITMMYGKNMVFWDFLNYAYNADKLFFKNLSFVEKLKSANYYMCLRAKGKFQILRLLESKGIDIVDRCAIKRNTFKRAIARDLEQAQYERLAIDGSKENPFNQKGVLEAVASLYRSTGLVDVLSVEKCKKLKEEIIKEVERAEDETFFSLK